MQADDGCARASDTQCLRQVAAQNRAAPVDEEIDARIRQRDGGKRAVTLVRPGQVDLDEVSIVHLPFGREFACQPKPPIEIGVC